MRGFFISATGTSVGKTFVSRALALSLRRLLKVPVAALKPLETGCAPDPADALALGHAAADLRGVHHPAFYRARSAVAPYAATLAGEPPVPATEALVQAVRELSAKDGVTLVEGAGGLLVPLDQRRYVADLARALDLPLLLVAPDELGVLSHCLTCLESARARGLRIAATVLTARHREPDDPSTASNRSILEQLANCPVLDFPYCTDDDDALSAAAVESGLLALAQRHLTA
jgi:dethiobiotin synthetase